MKSLKRVLPICLGMGLVFLVAGSLLAQETFIPRKQTKLPGPPLSPAEAIQKMTVPEGFTVELVVSEPDLVNPGGDDLRRTGPGVGHGVVWNIRVPRRAKAGTA